MYDTQEGQETQGLDSKSQCTPVRIRTALENLVAKQGGVPTYVQVTLPGTP